MEATGEIRRVDDLGRIVIPKTIRKELNIEEGATFEVFILNSGVYFKPYKFDQM